MTHHYRKYFLVYLPEDKLIQAWTATGNGPSDWFTSGIAQPAGTKSMSRPGNTVLRLSELDAAVRAALSGFSRTHSKDSTIDGTTDLTDVRINNWGRIMLGQEKHMKDALHQAMVPGGRLWADMMLFDLRKAVRESKQDAPWNRSSDISNGLVVSGLSSCDYLRLLFAIMNKLGESEYWI
jgi:hypothetical protein